MRIEFSNIKGRYIILYIRYLLSTYYVPDIVAGAGDISMNTNKNKKYKHPVYGEHIYFLVQGNKQAW